MTDTLPRPDQTGPAQPRPESVDGHTVHWIERTPLASHRRNDGWGWAAFGLWLVSRALLFKQWDAGERFIDHDVRYYFAQIHNQITAGTPGLVEYPSPIAWMMELFYRLTGDVDSFMTLFVIVMALLDFGAAAYLWNRRSRLMAAYWSVFTLLVGSLMWFRIDLLPALAVLFALLWAPSARTVDSNMAPDTGQPRLSRPAWAGAAMAIGAATKLWPAMLIGPLLGSSKAAKQRGLGFLAMGGGLGLASLLFAGWGRSISPLTWQSDRGLQIESIPATVPMLERVFGDQSPYRLELSKYNAWELFGPVEGWLKVGDVTMALTILAALALFWLIALGGVGLPGHSLANAAEKEGSELWARTVVMSITALIFAVLVANKTFSPQYVYWLAGPLAILIAQPGPERERTTNAIIGVSGLILAALTHWIFPIGYGDLLSATPGARMTIVLAIRNMLVVVLTIATFVIAVKGALKIGKK